MRKIIIIVSAVCCCFINSINGQVAITSDGSPPHPSAMLDVQSISKGMLIPTMTSVQRTAIAIPATGLIVFQTDAPAGFYYNAGSMFSPNWTRLAGGFFVDLTTNQTVAGNKTFTGQMKTITAAGTDDAIFGHNTAPAGTGTGAGIVGITSQANYQAAGVWAENKNANGTGLIALGNGQNSNTLAAGSGIAGTGLITGVYARSVTSGTGEALYADQFGDIVRVSYWNGSQLFKINGPGAVSTVVLDSENKVRTMYAPESPEVLLTDYGHGKLVNGKASIQIDPILSGTITVNQAHPLKVYIQVEGECNGVYVTNKSATGFEVVELMNGKSNIDFSYQIVANRADEIHEGTDENGNKVSRTSKNVGQRFPIAVDYRANFRPVSGGPSKRDK